MTADQLRDALFTEPGGMVILVENPSDPFGPPLPVRNWLKTPGALVLGTSEAFRQLSADAAQRVAEGIVAEGMRRVQAAAAAPCEEPQ